MTYPNAILSKLFTVCVCVTYKRTWNDTGFFLKNILVVMFTPLSRKNSYTYCSRNVPNRWLSAFPALINSILHLQFTQGQKDNDIEHNAASE